MTTGYIQYVPGKEHTNADVFSHLSLPEQRKEVTMPQELICLLESIEISPVTVYQIRSWTNRDPVLSQVRKFVQHGWPKSLLL